jgi:acid phosphatase type 7
VGERQTLTVDLRRVHYRMTARVGRNLSPIALAVVVFTLAASLHAARAQAADPVVGVAGDIACSSTTVQSDRCHQKATSDLLVNAGLAGVLALGDLQYQDGTLSEFMGSYDKSWGRLKSITYPAVGNHEYQTAGAAGYFDYFNGAGVKVGRAGDRSKGYYSFDIGTWHLISLNSSDQCTIISCAAGSAQETWLKADLAAHPNYCTLAYWHHPSFNSGNGGNLSAIKPLLQDLYDANAEVILGGHAHHYERFAPQNPSGSLDNARGIRQFVVGTGGAMLYEITAVRPNSEARGAAWGVAMFTLNDGGYSWQFIPVDGASFSDAGSGTCH